MNQNDAIQAQIAALLTVRNYLLNQTPSDMVALANVTENIVALNQRQAALSTQIGGPQLLSAAQQAALQSAITTLDAQVQQGATVSALLTFVTALLQAV